jgi:hypothetical protein
MSGKIKFIIIVIVGLGIGPYLYSSGAFTKGVGGFNAVFSPPSSSSTHGTSSSTASSSGGPSFWSFLGLPSTGSHPAGPSISPPDQQAPIITAPPGGSGGYSGTVNTNPAVNSNPNLNPANIPPGFTLAQLSPYFHEIRLSSVAPGTPFYYGTIILSDENYNNPSSTIDITGWEIRSKDGGEYIPGAIDVYDPSGLTPASDIIMKLGDDAYLYSSSAPFNLRLNECVGYIANVAKFEPPLPLYCPQVDQSQIQNFTGECQEYIDTLNGCAQPNMESSQIPQNDYACRDYLENNFNYRSCFEDHDHDPNFLSNQIFVWTGSNVVDQYHDSVELLDRNGLLVDLYTY